MATALGGDIRGPLVAVELGKRLDRFRRDSKEHWAAVACIKCGSTFVELEQATIFCRRCGNSAPFPHRQFGCVYGPDTKGDTIARSIITTLRGGDEEGEDDG